MLSAVAAAALTGVCATAQAQVLVEIEGPMSAYTADTADSGTMTVMNNKVAVTANTVFASPTETRADLFARRIEGQRVRNDAGAVYNVSNWMRGDIFEGRRQRGFIGATVIVVGTVDPVTGIVTADEVFSDIAENVVLGAIYENQCTNAACNEPGDFIRGNGPTGPVFVPNADNRLPALPITDAGLFELNLAGKDLGVNSGTITSFGGEGYLTQDPVPRGAGTEQAIVYYAFELGENRPDLLLNPGIPEISTLRVRCTEGSRIEVRGFVHAPTTAAGVAIPGFVAGANGAATNIPYPATGGAGRIRVEMEVNGEVLSFLDEDGEPPVADVPGVYGVYQLRQEVDQCGDSVTVYWERNGTDAFPWATTTAPVDRLREE
jgi:hypothetical protein